MADEVVETTETTEATGGEPEGGQAPALDTSGFDDRLNQLTETVQTGFEELRGRIPEPEPEPEPDPYEDWDDGGLFGETEQQDRERYQGALQDFVDRAVQARVGEILGPHAKQVETLKAHAVAASLKEQFPEFKDNEKAQEAFELVREEAFALTGNEQDARRLMLDERFFGLVYKASQAEQQATAQVPASEHVDELEPGGGASPGGTGEEPSIVDKVFERRGRANLPAFLR